MGPPVPVTITHSPRACLSRYGFTGGRELAHASGRVSRNSTQTPARWLRVREQLPPASQSRRVCGRRKLTAPAPGACGLCREQAWQPHHTAGHTPAPEAGGTDQCHPSDCSVGKTGPTNIKHREVSERCWAATETRVHHGPRRLSRVPVSLPLCLELASPAVLQ